MIQQLLNMNNGKKIDIILMNPPYDKNLHLKFLRKCINFAINIVNISPARWLQDPFAKDKRSTLKQYEDVAQHIASVDILNDKLKGQFDISAYSDLGIYILKDHKTNFDYKNFWETTRTDDEKSIIQKVCFSHKTKYISEVVEYDKLDGIRVMIGDIGGNRGTLPVYKDIVYTIDGNVGDKDWTECKNMGGYVKPKNSPLPKSIKFDTTSEAENFWKSYRELKFFNVLCNITIQQQHIQLNVLPFLKNYKKEITDNDMFNLFGLTDDEIQFIENYPLKKK